MNAQRPANPKRRRRNQPLLRRQTRRRLGSAARWAGVVEGSGKVRRRDADRDAEPGGRLARAWRWLQSSGFDDHQARYGPVSKEQFWRAVLTQSVFWWTNR